MLGNFLVRLELVRGLNGGVTVLEETCRLPTINKHLSRRLEEGVFGVLKAQHNPSRVV